MDFREWYEQDGCHYMASEASLKSTWIAAKESAKREIDNLRAKNEALYEDNKALRDYVASLIGTLPKIKADAIRDAMKDCEYRVTGVGHVISHVELSKHADKIEQGEK